MGKNNAKNLEGICEFFDSKTCEKIKECNGYGIILGARHFSGNRMIAETICRSYSPKREYQEKEQKKY